MEGLYFDYKSIPDWISVSLDKRRIIKMTDEDDMNAYCEGSSIVMRFRLSKKGGQGLPGIGMCTRSFMGYNGKVGSGDSSWVYFPSEGEVHYDNQVTEYFKTDANEIVVWLRINDESGNVTLKIDEEDKGKVVQFVVHDKYVPVIVLRNKDDMGEILR